MDELLDPENEREESFHQQVHDPPDKLSTRNLRIADSILDELDGDETGSDTESDDGSDIHDNDDTVFNAPLCRVRSQSLLVEAGELAKTSVDIVAKGIGQICDDVTKRTLTTADHTLPELLAKSHAEYKIAVPSPLNTTLKVSSVHSLVASF